MGYQGIPSRVILSGHKESAEKFVGHGHSLMQLCKQSVVFQDLDYYKMRREFEVPGGKVDIEATAYGPLSTIRIFSPEIKREEEKRAVGFPVAGGFSVTLNFSPEPVFEWQQANSTQPFRRVMVQDIFEPGQEKTLADVEEVFFSVSRDENGVIRVNFYEDSLLTIDGVVSSKKIDLGDDKFATVCQNNSARNIGFVGSGDYGVTHKLFAVNNAYVDSFIAKGRDVLCFPSFGAAGRVWRPVKLWSTALFMRTDVDRYMGGDISPTARPTPTRPWSPSPHTVDTLINTKMLVRITDDGFERPDLVGSCKEPEFNMPVCVNPVSFPTEAFFPVVSVKRTGLSGIVRDVKFKCEALGCIHPHADSPFRTVYVSRSQSLSDALLGFRRAWLYPVIPFPLSAFSGCILDFKIADGVLSALQPFPVIPSNGGELLGYDEYTWSGEHHSYFMEKVVLTDSWPPESESLIARANAASWEQNYVNLNKSIFTAHYIPSYGGSYLYGIESDRHYFHTGYDNVFRMRFPLYVGGVERLGLCEVRGQEFEILKSDNRPFDSEYSDVYSKWTVNGVRPANELSFVCSAGVEPVDILMRNTDDLANPYGLEYPEVTINHGKTFSIKCGERDLYFVNHRKESKFARFVPDVPIINHLNGNNYGLQLGHGSTWVDLHAVHSKTPLTSSLVGDIPLFRGERFFRTEDSSPFSPGNLTWETQVDDAYLDPFTFTAVFEGEAIDISTPFAWATAWGSVSAGNVLSVSYGSCATPYVYCFDHRQAGHPKLDIFCEAVDKDHSLYRDMRSLPEEQKRWRLFATFGDGQPVEFTSIFFPALVNFLSRNRDEEELVDLADKIRLFSPGRGPL